TVTVAGTGIPGSTVTVTYPDGTTGSVPVDASGNYTLTSPGAEPNGTVSVTDTFNGQTSAPTEVGYSDTTAPAAPATPVVTGNPDG
ncbi:Ig-like domain-containing protein, partial [Paraburkholderia rhynchosiae]